MIKYFLALVAGLPYLLTGCAQTSSPVSIPAVEPFQVIVDPAQLDLSAGNDAQLAAEADDSAGLPIGGARFSYTPTDPKVLRVSATGLVTALGPATTATEIVVASGRRERRVPVTILPGPPARIEKLEGDGQQLRAGMGPPASLSFKVVDSWGNALGNVQIVAEPGADSAPVDQVVSGLDGTGQVQLPTPKRAGTVTVSLRPKGLDKPVATFELHVAPGPPATIRMLDAENALIVTDGNGNPVADVPVQIQLAGSKTPAVIARTDANGVAKPELPTSTRPRRLTLHVELVDTPSIQATLSMTAPATPR